MIALERWFQNPGGWAALGATEIIDAQTLQTLYLIEYDGDHIFPGRVIAWSPDSTKFVTASNTCDTDDSRGLCDTPDYALIDALSGEILWTNLAYSVVYSAEFIDDNQIIVRAEELHFVDTSSGEIIKTLDMNGNSLSGFIRFDVDQLGNRIAYNDIAQEVLFIDVDTDVIVDNFTMLESPYFIEQVAWGSNNLLGLLIRDYSHYDSNSVLRIWSLAE